MRQKLKTNRQVLTGFNATRSDVDQPWEQDNQAWWDWYVTLDENNSTPPEVFMEVPIVSSNDLANNAEVYDELKEPFHLPKEDIEQFRRNGFLKLKNVLSQKAVECLRYELVKLLAEASENQSDQPNVSSFLSLDMSWLNNPLIKAFVLSERIAKICAELLGVSGIRLYHDNILSKEPGCGRTPWHYDDHPFPLATDDVVTAWIPAQPIPVEMGPLAFAKPLEVFELIKNIEFNKFDTSYDRQIAEVFKEKQVLIDDSEFELGEVSFHHNRSLHTAGPNYTNQSRVVLASTYFVDGAKILETPTMVSGDWQRFIPDTAPGGLAASVYNPICWQMEKK